MGTDMMVQTGTGQWEVREGDAPKPSEAIADSCLSAIEGFQESVKSLRVAPTPKKVSVPVKRVPEASKVYVPDFAPEREVRKEIERKTRLFD